MNVNVILIIGCPHVFHLYISENSEEEEIWFRLSEPSTRPKQTVPKTLQVLHEPSVFYSGSETRTLYTIKAGITRLCHIGHGFFKVSLILYNSDRKVCEQVM